MRRIPPPAVQTATLTAFCVAAFFSLAAAQTPQDPAPQATPPPPGAPPAPPAVQPGSSAQGTLPEPTWLDRLRFNARERTARGLEALENEQPLEALRPFRTAGRLQATDPLAQFNAGTAELLVPEEQADAASSLAPLSFAAENSSDELAPTAHYNLGNAHLAAGDPGAAIEAYKASLRAAPDNPEAKFNLEVALRRLQQQQQQQQQPDDQPSEENDEEDNEQEQPQQPGESPADEPSDEPQGEEEPDEDEQQDFEDQPDMTAEQAAAILEAVENLEREQRREQAAERARESSKKGKDW